MKPGEENSKSNCVSDNSYFFFNYVPMIFQFYPDIGAFQGEHSPVPTKWITCNFWHYSNVSGIL